MLPKALKNQTEHIPNSIAHKNTQLENAKNALLKAKSLNRPVRKAKSNECAFSRERERTLNAEPRKLTEREDGLISVKDAVEFYGISQFSIQDQRKKGLIPHKKEKGKYYYNLEDLKKIPVKKYRNSSKKNTLTQN